MARSIVMFLLVIFSAAFSKAADLTAALKYLPTQEAGRIKPFDSFAREVLFVLHGKEKVCKESTCRPAHEVIFTMLLQPQLWQEQPLIEIKRDQLKEALRLSKDQKHFTPNQIVTSPRLSLVFQELEGKRATKEKLDPYFQAVQRLENQLFTFRELSTGHMFRLLPPKEGETWVAIPAFEGPARDAFMKITDAFMAAIAAYSNPNLPSADADKIKKEMEAAVEDFKALARAENPALYPSDFDKKLEVHYNAFHPFHWSWILYALAFVFWLTSWITRKEKLHKFAMLFTILGFLLHSYGFFLRVYLTGRPPVSNMYETVVWVSWGAVLFSFIIFQMYRFRLVPLAGTAVAAVCLILSDAAPSILDPTLQPLEPVLRSNFWLTTHVLIITISYAAFFLALGIGNTALVFYMKDENQYRDAITACVNSIYRAIQIGVVLLAAGIILGGVWADYSWGRFWGWDPKETWALIALLGYLAVLHGRIGGWLADFGLVVGSIVSFSLVVMAWYGVNYILGAGLHSYGFGAGGVEVVLSVIAIQWLFVVFVAIIRQGRNKIQPKT
ncbi:MAG: cytochrome c biogenesis protein [Pseudobdellovibrionaceae bacterium]